MKKIIIALAFVLAGGAALSTANAASLAPAVATVAEAAQSGGDASLQLVGGYGYKKRHWGHRSYHKGGYYKKHFKFYPRGYYKGFCYDKPSHGWCKKNFYKKGVYKYDFDKKDDAFKVR
ncbi:MAG: hypothetical protein ACFCUR_13320 [Rhodomicrobiaceae bacterium]